MPGMYPNSFTIVYKYRKEIENPAWPIDASSVKVLNQAESRFKKQLLNTRCSWIHPHQNTKLLHSMSMSHLEHPRKPCEIASPLCTPSNYLLEQSTGSNELYQPDLSEYWITVCHIASVCSWSFHLEMTPGHKPRSTHPPIERWIALTALTTYCWRTPCSFSHWDLYSFNFQKIGPVHGA